MTAMSPRFERLGVHSLDHIAIAVPDLDLARDYYSAFGLDVRDTSGGLDLYTFGHPHRWMRVLRGDRKQLKYLSFGVFAEDVGRFHAHISDLGVGMTEPPASAPESLWLTDPNGIAVEIRAAEKCSPDVKPPPENRPPSLRGAPMRSEAPVVKPRRMSHAAFFTSALDATLDFYISVLGLRLSDRSGPAGFLHGIHGSDHHMVAFGESGTTGYHHSAWDVGSIDEVGLGAGQMAQAGYAAGWGLGRHALGSNYFHYVRDPWGSFTEYSFDIDYIPAGFGWTSIEASPENSLFLWGPAPPADFGVNSEEGRK